MDEFLMGNFVEEINRQKSKYVAFFSLKSSLILELKEVIMSRWMLSSASYFQMRFILFLISYLPAR